MKKLLAALLMVLALMFAFTACFGTDGSTEDQDPPVVEDDRTVELSETEIVLTKGETHTLVASLSVGKADFVWTSSAPEVASVSADGVVTALAVGEATITATADGKSASCKVTVNPPAEIPAFEDDDQSFTVSVNKTATINTKVLYEGAAVDAALTFSSEDENIATVSDAGVITGVGVGTTTIQVKAEYDGMSVYMTVDVEVRVNINVEAPAQTVNLGTVTINGTTNKDTAELYLKVFCDDAEVTETTDITWTLTGDCVSMTANGAEANIKSLCAGSATVVASFTLYGKDYDYTFTVNVAKTELTLTADADRNMTVDLTAIDGTITALTVGEKSYLNAVSEGILTLDRDVVRGGTHQVTVTTADDTYTFDIIVPIEEYTVTIPTGTGYTVTGETKVTEHNEYVFTVESTEVELYSISEVKVNGEIITGTLNTYKISAATENIVIEVTVVKAEVIELSMDNAGTPSAFAAIINAKPDGYYVLTEHLQWSGASSSAIPNFTGVLDGKGYAIANFKISQVQDNGRGDDRRYSTQLFGMNSGKIRNIFFIANISNATSGDHFGGIIYRNEGVVSNCYVEFTVNDTLTSWRQYAAIASENNSGGQISNCVVNFVMNSPASNEAHIGTLVSYNNTGAALLNCYTLLNGAAYQNGTKVSYVGYANGGSASNVFDFDDMAHYISLKDDYGFDSAKGWASYWSIVGDTIIFGDVDNQPERPETFTVTLPTGDNFTVTGETQVKQWTDYTFSVEVAEGYVIDTVTVNGEEVTLSSGAYTVTSVSSALTIDVTVKTEPKPIEINATNAATLSAFIALINADPAATYILTENLDFGGAVSGTVIKNFSGTLDGQGYTISNFEIKYGANAAVNNYISVLFEVNNGTIQNIGFDYTLGTANSSYVGLIEKNNGTIQNVYVNVNFAAYQSATGAIAAINSSTGKVLNCITNINTTLTSEAAKNSLGAIVGVDYNGTIKNCYAIVNGVHELTTPYVQTWGGGSYSGNANYADMAALTSAVTELSSANGWSSYWSIANGEVVFGTATTTTPDTAHTCESVCAECGKCLDTTCTEAACTEKCAGHDSVAVTPETCTAHADKGDGTCVCGAILLTDANAGDYTTFASKIEANLAGYYVLMEDLDFLNGTSSGQGTAAINTFGVLADNIEFTGTLDGQGYAIKNFHIRGTGYSDYVSYVFKSNSGTIKNLYLMYGLKDALNNYGGFIGNNTGTVSNVYAEVIYDQSISSTYGMIGAIVCQNMPSGVVENCIANITYTSGVTIKAQGFGLVGQNQPTGDNTPDQPNGIVRNCYVINNGNVCMDYTSPDANISVPVCFNNGSTVENSAAYATVADLIAANPSLSSDDGWAEYWSIADGAVTFAPGAD